MLLRIGRRRDEPGETVQLLVTGARDALALLDDQRHWKRGVLVVRERVTATGHHDERLETCELFRSLTR